MNEVHPFERALAPLGFQPIFAGAFKGEWSTGRVEHFLFLENYGGDRYLAAWFAVRHRDAERFARELVVRYGSSLTRTLPPWDERTFYMRFSLGELVGWKPRSSLSQASLSREEIEERLTRAVQEELLPLVKPIQTAADLLAFLLRNSGPIRWSVTNGAIRATECLYLCKESKLPADEVLAQLLQYEADIRRGLDTDTAEIPVFLRQTLNVVPNGRP